MDLAAAERLASVADPKAVAALQKHSTNPAVTRAVAEQFGAQLLQRVMQNGDGEAIGMAGGIGGNMVNSLFASTVAQAGMSGDKLGLADMLFRSIEAKQQGTAAAAPAAAAPAVPTVPTVQTVPRSGGGFPLSPYWQGNGMRPLGSGAGPQPPASPGSASAGIVSPPALAAAVAILARRQSPPAFALPPPQPAATAAAAPPSSGAPPLTGGASAEQIADFSRQLGPALQQAAQQLGVSPKILLAQAALETGWGRSVVGNNVFGIKAGPSWSGAQVSAPTHEVENGRLVAQQASFRSYPSLAAAVQDYVSLITASPRYQTAIGLGGDAQGYGQALIDGGYATDTGYANKLATVAAGPSVTAAFATAPPLSAGTGG